MELAQRSPAMNIYRITDTATDTSLGLSEGASAEDAIAAIDAARAELEAEGAVGHVAIDAARADELGDRYELCSYTDPTAEGREGISISEAEDIAAEDAGLVYMRRIPREYGSDRSVTIQTRVTAGERDAWDAAAAAARVSRSEWLRAVANANAGGAA